MVTHPVAETLKVARGIGTAVAGPDGLTDLQVALLGAVTLALTGQQVDYTSLDPLGPAELAAVLADSDESHRRRIVHHMVLGELVLVPIPAQVAETVATYAKALDVDDDFVSIAREYAENALTQAWDDLHRSGFASTWDQLDQHPLHTKAAVSDPFERTVDDPELADRWRSFAELPAGTLGQLTWEMYQMRGWEPPGTKGGMVSAYFAQHDFVHVLADYGTNIQGEVEIFGLIGRADPDPKGFSWLATIVGLFETGYVEHMGYFDSDVEDHWLRVDGMAARLADSIVRGKSVQEGFGTDLLRVDYHELADRPIDEVRSLLSLPPKSALAVAAGSPGAFDFSGLSSSQQRAATNIASEQ
ncbi:MAG: hypothetical protein WCK41_12025 [Actinomycetes bacterium]